MRLFRFSTKANHNWRYRCVFRICLIVSLWEAPLPWFHAHSVLCDNDRLESRIVQHLETFHSGHELQVSHHGWHLHFATPREMDDERRAPLSGDSGDRDASLYGPRLGSLVRGPQIARIGALRLVAHGAMILGVNDCVVVPFDSANANGVTIGYRHFVDTFTASVSVCNLLCVVRC